MKRCAIPFAAGVLALPALVFAQTSAPARQTPQAPHAPMVAPLDSLHVHVNLVNVPVTVIGASGAPVRGLRKQDFILTEDGQVQTIRLFEPEASRQLSLVLAIDTSVSVRKDLGLEKQSAYIFIHSLLRPTDKLELLAFAGEVTEAVPFTHNLREIDRGLNRLHGDGPTALYEAIAHGGEDLRPLPGRRVLVVVSDGANSMPGVDFAAARTAALRAQASIESIILVPIAANAGRDLGGEHALIQLSRDTGGQYFYVSSPAQLPDALAHVSQALRSEYLLGYYPASAQAGAPSQHGFRQIQVRMTNPALNEEYRLHYRTGYYASAAH